MGTYKPKTLSVAYVNRMKYEKPDEFSDSLFEDVYRSACRLTKKIILDNENLEENIPDPEYSTDEQCSNVIAFLGGRGMGKSSAMLSFALFLKNYIKVGQCDFSVDTPKISPVFSVLPRIDVAMMVKGENVMDIILAKMWDAFERRSEATHKREIYLEEMKDDFKRVKKSYEIYKKTLAEKEVIQNMTSIREMHELAACLNMREDFKNLVENYLGFVLADKICRSEERFLVISIDDLDMVMYDMYSILEQVRLFLMIPKVIVLITADLERLSMACNKQFAESLISREIFEPYDKQPVREYASNYLAKLFPRNMRVFMPEIGTFAGTEYEVVVDGESFDEKKLILVMMAKYSNIFWDPYCEKSFFLQKSTLRKIVNNLYLLQDISNQKEEEWFGMVCHWYFIELTEYCKGIENVELRQKLLELLEVYTGDADKSYLNIVVWKGLIQAIQTNNINNNMLTGVGYEYGDIMLLLDTVHYQERVFNFVSLAFGIQIAQLKRKNKSDIYFGNKIFGTFLGRQNINDKNGIEKVHSLGNMLDMILENIDDLPEEERIIKIINNNIKGIVEVFRICILCGVNVWDSEKAGYTEWTFSKTDEKGVTKEIGQTKVDIKDNDSGSVKMRGTIEGKAGWSVLLSMDYLFTSAAVYEENIRGFVFNLYTGLAKYYDTVNPQEQIIAEVEQIVNAPAWHLQEYRDWRSAYDIHATIDVLPLESVGTMYSLAKYIESNIWSSGRYFGLDGCTVDILQVRLDLLCQGLERIERYYECGALRYHKYSAIISQYLNIIQVTDLSAENRKKLDMPVYELYNSFRPVV